MESSSLSITSTTSALNPTSTSTIPDVEDNVPAHHVNSVVAFMIGFAIVLLASILNAGGLNLTKLDHVRTSAIPRASRRKDWLRPLWLLGMILYILSQLIGSTLALEYLRAEYVAPLGSSSLIFNFLFASLLIGTPVTNTDIYGTIIVIAGVVGIVLFGSINSGLESEMDIARLASLWSRTNWILYFIFWSVSLALLYVFASQLELILTSRSDISSEPFAGQGGRPSSNVGSLSGLGWRKRFVSSYQGTLWWVREKLELWTMTKDDKTLAWTLGIGWACCGGGLAGGCLVFAKACVKMISGALSHVNTGNQFFHFAAIVTFLFLAVTAVFQIICLNRGLKVYDSTLVVPVFYGVYTASGFLNSLIFNNEIDQYKSWTLFLIFVSIFILVSGVVLLTYKKPESAKKSTARGIALSSTLPASRNAKKMHVSKDSSGHDDDEEEEVTAMHPHEGEDEVMWDLGQASDDEDAGDDDDGKKVRDHHAAHGSKIGGGGESEQQQHQGRGLSASGQATGEEGRGLMQLNDDGTHDSELW